VERAAGREQLLHHGLETPVDFRRLQRGTEDRHPGSRRQLDQWRNGLEPLGDDDARDGKRKELGEYPASLRFAERAQVRDLGLAEDLYALRRESADIPREGEPRTRHIRVLDLPLVAVRATQLLDQLPDGDCHRSPPPLLGADRAARPADVQPSHSAQLGFEVRQRRGEGRPVVAPGPFRHEASTAREQLELDTPHAPIFLEPDDAGHRPR